MEQQTMTCPHCGKIIPKSTLTGRIQQKPSCPICGSARSFRDGFRQTRSGNVQRYLCRDCGSRFS